MGDHPLHGAQFGGNKAVLAETATTSAAKRSRGGRPSFCVASQEKQEKTLFATVDVTKDFPVKATGVALLTPRPLSRAQCPAADKACNRCGEKRHHLSVCLSCKKNHPGTQSTRQATPEEVQFLKVTQQLWDELLRIIAAVHSLTAVFIANKRADGTFLSSSDDKVMGPIS